MSVKEEIKSCRFARECASFVYTCMDLTTQLDLHLHEQTQIITDVDCREGNLLFNHHPLIHHIMWKLLQPNQDTACT